MIPSACESRGQRTEPTTAMTQASLIPDAADRRTRQRVLEAAVGLLARQGLAPDLLGRAAAAGGCAPERARGFFGRDEEVILALYARLAADLEARVLDLPEGSVAERFHAAVMAKFALADRYR